MQFGYVKCYITERKIIVSDISDFVPVISQTISRIFEEYKKKGDTEPNRGYLGASIIGHPCERYLWYCFRQCCQEDTEGRIYRLFETGDREEERMVANLRMIGCEVHDTDETGSQFEILGLGGHFSGHMDGCALGIPEAPKTWHVLEFKTHNKKSFAKLKKHGVKETKPQHYAQMMAYMHFTGMKRALYLAVNKDTDDLYSERIHYNKEEGDALVARAKRIITSHEPPARAFPKKDYFECEYCSAQGICWGTNTPDPVLSIVLSCRQCCHAEPVLTGNDAFWKCAKETSPNPALKPCIDHICLPGLFSFANAEDFEKNSKGQGSIVFKNEDGIIWRHSVQNDTSGYSSSELIKISRENLSNGMLLKSKEHFSAEIKQQGENILESYPEEDCEIIWKGIGRDIFSAWKENFDEELLELAAIKKVEWPDYKAAEFSDGRLAIVWSDGKAEIRKGKE